MLLLLRNEATITESATMIIMSNDKEGSFRRYTRV